MTFKHRAYVYSYNAGSGGAKALAKAMGILRIKHESSGFRPTHRKVLINWGCSQLPTAYLSECGYVLNPPSLLPSAQDKLRFFQRMTAGQAPIEVKDFPRIPRWTVDKDVAKRWKRPIVARKVLTGHSGQGIVYCEVGGELPNAPLYVEYIKKADEYRVHYIRNPQPAVSPHTFIQRKVRVRDNHNPNWTVRNLAGGFAYANDPSNVGSVPQDVLDQSLKAFVASGLDFGAVDVVWNEKQKKAYVLEINTAPGLQGRTVQFYADGLKQLVG